MSVSARCALFRVASERAREPEPETKGRRECFGGSRQTNGPGWALCLSKALACLFPHDDLDGGRVQALAVLCSAAYENELLLLLQMLTMICILL